MSSEVLISLRGIGKSYPKFDKPFHGLAHMLVPGRHARHEFHALRDVSLDIRRGEAIGIIGKNGSGKSTLLQVIAGILQPSAGEMHVHARIAALLELGAGFNPEFTGRENIHLNASLLGLGAQQIADRMERIIGFAEIGEHLDQQVKTYSSGMFLRLAFAVAVHTDPDVLIVDEALSVGDVYFQRKCFKRIEEMREAGCTLLLVTHSVDSVLQLCDRGVVLDGGVLMFDGDAQPAVKEYLRIVFGDNSGYVEAEDTVDATESGLLDADDMRPPTHDELALFLRADAPDRFHARPGYNRDETRLGDGRAVTCDYLVSSSLGYGPLVPAREPFRIHVRYRFPIALERLMFGVRVCSVSGQVLYSSNTFVSDGRLYACRAGSVAVVAFDLQCALLRGQYFVTVGVSKFDEQGDEIHAIDRRMDSVILSVTGDSNHAEGLADMQARFAVQGLAGEVVSTQ
ncbi:MAG TPA: ABC transporter ATP-binding protein [Luteimonas sp.]|nr:ABC transporter ATP-binding protein [Luteimonas sp.]